MSEKEKKLEQVNHSKNSTKAKYSIQSVVAYALALATALGINELSLTVFKSLNLGVRNEIITKFLYVIFMVGLIVAYIYATDTTVSI